MKQINILRNGQVTNSAQFESEEELQAWYQTHVDMGSFGEHTSEILDVSAELEAQAAKQAKIDAGKAAREVCTQVLDLVAGYNLDRELSIQEISEMQATFSNIELALRGGRPTLAKQMISFLTPDGILITQAMKNDCLSILEQY